MDVVTVNPFAQSAAIRMEGRPLRSYIPCLLVLPLPLVASCSGPDERSAAVHPGIEVLVTDSAHLLDGLRVGLVTNHTGRTRNGTPSAIALRGVGVDVVALFAPEHGLGGQVVGGQKVGDDTDEQTTFPVYSLYGDSRAPDPDVLKELDALVFDVQDIGARYYTYVSTMIASMEAAAGAGILFVVADRPNPIGGGWCRGMSSTRSSHLSSGPIPCRCDTG